MRKIESIESRFKEVSGLDVDLSIYPLSKSDGLQVQTRQAQSKSHGEVFTPLWLVDEMLEKVSLEKYKQTSTTLDLCSGYGQFSIRLIRKYMKAQGNKFNLEQFFENHWFSEMQNSSAYKLMYIFGKDINIAIGDAMELKNLHDNASGIYHLVDGKWENKTKRFANRTEEWFKRMYMKDEQ